MAAAVNAQSSDTLLIVQIDAANAAAAQATRTRITAIAVVAHQLSEGLFITGVSETGCGGGRLQPRPDPGEV